MSQLIVKSIRLEQNSNHQARRSQMAMVPQMDTQMQGIPSEQIPTSLPEFPIRMMIWWKLEMPGRLLKDQELVLVVVD